MAAAQAVIHIVAVSCMGCLCLVSTCGILQAGSPDKLIAADFDCSSSPAAFAGKGRAAAVSYNQA